jgi:hypothetical protein
MANMSYVRFENTYRDLDDCCAALDDMQDIRKLDEQERYYALALIKLCKQITDDHGELLTKQII